MHYRGSRNEPISINSAEPSLTAEKHPVAPASKQVMFYSLTRATLWNLAGYLYLIVASLVATPILIAHLGLALFGQYGLIIATLALVSSLDLGLPQAVTRALARNHQFSPRRQTIWATSSLLFVATGLLAGLASAFAAYYLHVSYSTIPVIFAIAVMNNLLAHYLTLPHAQGHFGYFNIKTFIVGTGNTLLAAFLAGKGQGIAAILSAQLLCYLITLLPLVSFSLKYFPRPWQGRPSRNIASSLISFGLKNQAGKLVGQLQSQYGKYLLAALSPLALSAYIVAQGLVQKLAGGITQLSSALYPASSRATGRFPLRRLYYRLQLALFLLALLGVTLYSLVGYSFLSWWLHAPELVTLVDSVLKILVWYFAILALSPLASTILDSHGRPELTSLFAALTTILEITLALYLFPRYGLYAPAYAALLAILVMTPPLLYVTARVLRHSTS